jgi:hypothetical protein
MAFATKAAKDEDKKLRLIGKGKSPGRKIPDFCRETDARATRRGRPLILLMWLR